MSTTAATATMEYRHSRQQHALLFSEHHHHHNTIDSNHHFHSHDYLQTTPTQEHDDDDDDDMGLMTSNSDSGDNGNNDEHVAGGGVGVNVVVPNEADLVLLCLDYLRDLRRAYSSISVLQQQEGLKAEYLTMACWALNRAFCPNHLPNLTYPDHGNDCWTLDNPNNKHTINNNNNNTNHTTTSSFSGSYNNNFPSLQEMERELLLCNKENPTDGSNHRHHHHYNNSTIHGDQKKEQDYDDDDYSPSSSCKEDAEHHHHQQLHISSHQYNNYEYNDNHVSNAHRFYSLDGLASGPISSITNNIGSTCSGGGSLTLGEIVAAGLVGLGAKTRWQAEQEMLSTPLFEQFVAAVKAKGFFDISSADHPNNDTTLDSHYNHHHHHHRGTSSAQQAQQQAAELYEERFRKVVAKFRVKLAHKAMMALQHQPSSSPSLSQQSHQHHQHHMDNMMLHGEEMTQSTAGGCGGVGLGSGSADWSALVAADQQRKQREYRLGGGHGHYNNANAMLSSAVTTPTNTASPGTPLDELTPNRLRVQQQYHVATDDHRYHQSSNPLHSNVENASDVGSSHIGTDVSAASYVKRTAFAQRLFADAAVAVSDQHSVITSSSAAQAENHPADLEEAERLKLDGNSFMKQKEYQKAADCYTEALKLSPAGPQAHVYFSNRAAALVSLRKFSKAILDSERSLSLKPDYGKAHARLGLAHFLLGNYRQAIQAYALALKYEPDNKSSRSYMEKAEKRLAETTRQSSSSSVNSNNLSGEGVTGRPPKTTSGGYDVSRSNSYTSSAAAPRDENTNHSQHHHHQSSSSSQYSSSGHRRSSSNASHSTLLRDEKEAEKYKTKGNALMANREYSKALEAYNQAVGLSPAGPQSHVYYSNRAAALCYLERYKEAEEDSMQSLSLDPTYGKAHARLGLSRFFLQKYAGAVEAYSDALKYDPDNSASRSYLAKAKAKLNETATISARSSSSGSNYNYHVAMTTVSPPEATARRLMTDESVRIMTQRALQDPSRDLLHDPEMIRLSKKAMAVMRK